MKTPRPSTAVCLAMALGVTGFSFCGEFLVWGQDLPAEKGKLISAEVLLTFRQERHDFFRKPDSFKGKHVLLQCGTSEGKMPKDGESCVIEENGRALTLKVDSKGRIA